MNQKKHPPNKGFTLIELLTVIAIIGVLAAIIIPAVGGVSTSALESKTKSMYGQWAVALEQFRQDYGYVPVLETAEVGETSDFVALLEGNGSTHNTKNIRYYSFAEDSFGRDDDRDSTNDGNLVDAFGNDGIGMAVDTNRDGIIDTDLPNSDQIGGIEVPTELRASVVFWSLENDEYDYPGIASWK